VDWATDKVLLIISLHVGGSLWGKYLCDICFLRHSKGSWNCLCAPDVHRKITGISSAPTQVTCVVLTPSLTRSAARNRIPPYIEVIDQLLRAG